MMHILAIFIGKIVLFGLRLTGRRGSALPGLVVERLFPRFVPEVLSSISSGVIVITGTNGKTTSTKMLTHVLKSKYSVLTNPTGSNFVRGIASTIIRNSDYLGRLHFDIAVFELDEAHAALFVKIFKPRGVIITNVMRDQMDRFGEIDHTAKLIEQVVASATGFVVLNKNDPRVSAMSNNTHADVGYFGVAPRLRHIYMTDEELGSGKLSIMNEDKSESVLAELRNLDNSGEVSIAFGKEVRNITLKAGGSFNAQNATAVCAAAVMMDMTVDEITTSITEVEPAFGRGEVIKYGNKRIVLQLVKNPSGFRHALISQVKIKHDAIIMAINDDYADGRDVSWLWDVDFSRYDTRDIIYTTGTRAADMALRLKYDGIVVKNIDAALNSCLDLALASISADGSLIIYTTYTAMLALRKTLSGMVAVEKV